jgi:cysteine synthase
LRSCWLAKWSSPLSEREIQKIQEHEREIQEIEIWTKKTVWINQYKNQWNPSQQGNATATLRRHPTFAITPP